MDGPTATAQVGQGRRPNVRRPWPKLPRWFVAGIAVASLAIAGVLGYAVVLLARDPQPVTERRTPSAEGVSHDVGDFQFRDVVQLPVDCGPVSGLRVSGATQEDAELLADVVKGVCKNIRIVAAPAEDRLVEAARAGTVIGFAQFERTGEDSTSIAGSQPRIAVNTRFSVRGKSFKGYLAGVVIHELTHSGGPAGPVSADEEFLARSLEHELCTIVRPPNSEIGRSCGDAKAIVELGQEAAIAQLKTAGAQVLYCQADVSSREDHAAMLSDIENTFGRLDVLVNNAG
ncbi:MAG: SDR family NAD(P)-dependent oxidoreductase, partial [Mycobacteriales bacterium]